ncbi:Lipoprotein-releasing system ATP-binding protein LolD [subsurface metagenome]
MNEIIIETENLSKVFTIGGQEIKALDGVDLKVTKGEFISIIGPSGSGKTTLLNLIGLLEQPSGGSVSFEGQDVSKLRESDLDNLRLKQMGFIFQTFNLMATFTALENVTFPMEITHVPEKERLDRAKTLLDRLGLAKRMHHKPKELSAGESQRVAIARALANEPVLLLADEPTGNLDSNTTKEIAELLQRLNNEYGIAIILVTHDNQVAESASRTLHMVDGRLDSDYSR